MTKICEYCKKQYEPTGVRQKTCSSLCWNKMDYERNKEKYKENAKRSRPKQAEKRREKNKHKYIKICKECGIEFKKNSPNQIYCTIKCQRTFLDRKHNYLGKLQQWRKKTYLNNKVQRIKENTKYQIKRRKEDLLFCMIHRLRTRTNAIFKSKNWNKENHTFELLGCTSQMLKEHLEKQFKDGMTWENKGKWHIDHIIPLSSAKTEQELFLLCNYTNLQPLWAEDNLSKGNKH